jgi:hypothetical protein
MKTIRLTESELISLIRQTIKEQKCEKGFGCKGKGDITGSNVSKKDGISGGDGGSGSYVDVLNQGTTFKAISDYASYNEDDKDNIDMSYNKEKSMLSPEIKPPGKKNKMDYYTAAWFDADRFNRKNSNVEYTKFFDPTTGDFKNPEDKSKFGTDVFFPFYKHYFPNKTKISPSDVINLFKDKLGSIDKFVQVSSTGYKIQ